MRRQFFWFFVGILLSFSSFAFSTDTAIGPGLWYGETGGYGGGTGFFICKNSNFSGTAPLCQTSGCSSQQVSNSAATSTGCDLYTACAGTVNTSVDHYYDLLTMVGTSAGSAGATSWRNTTVNGSYIWDGCRNNAGITATSWGASCGSGTVAVSKVTRYSNGSVVNFYYLCAAYPMNANGYCEPWESSTSSDCGNTDACTSNPYGVGCICSIAGVCNAGLLCRQGDGSNYWAVSSTGACTGSSVSGSTQVYVSGGHIVVDNGYVSVSNLSSNPLWVQNDYSHALYVQGSVGLTANTVETMGDYIGQKVGEAVSASSVSFNVNISSVSASLGDSELPSGTTDSAYIVAPSTLTLAATYSELYVQLSTTPWLGMLTKLTLPVPASALDLSSGSAITHPCFTWAAHEYCADIPYLADAFQWAGWLVLFFAFYVGITLALS